MGVSQCGPIGVDVEIIRGRDSLEPSSRWHLTASEWEHVCSLPERDRAVARYKMWTAKEAFVKAIGLGVSFGLERVETEAEEDGTMRIGRINESRRLAKGWHLFHRVLTLAAQTAVVAMALGGSPGSCLLA
jgi:4'-phosphopantetheinyl transferase